MTLCSVLLALFIVIERRAQQPIMPLRLFASSERAAAYAARLLFLAAMIGFFFFTTLYLQEELHFAPALTGLAFLPATIVNFGVAMLLQRLTRAVGNGPLLATGLSLCVCGMAWLSRADASGAYWSSVALPMMLIGAGQGLTLGPLTVSGIKGVAALDAGAASGVVNVAHQIGSALGLAVLVSAGAFGAAGMQGAALLAHQVRAALTTGTALLVLALVLVLVFIIRPSASTFFPSLLNKASK